MNPELSVIIPAYNEALRIGNTLEAVSAYLKAQPYSSEILVVDDCSKDATLHVLARFPDTKILKNEVNRGKGYSIQKGMLAATGTYRLFMDADHSVRIENLPQFLNEMKKGAQIVIASIELPGSNIKDDNYSYRRVFGKWAKRLIRAMAVPGIYDTQRGFKLFTAEAAKAVFLPLKTYRWGFDIEILTRAQKMGFKIKEIAVDWNNSRASSVNLFSYFHTLYELVKIKFCV